MNLSFLTQFIDANKIGGWVRAGVASALGYLLAHYAAKWPMLADVLNPQVQAAIGMATATLVVGVWQQLTKTDTAKLAAVAAMSGPDKQAAFTGIPDTAKIAAVTALPGVSQVVVNSTATGGVAAAAADPAQPKVVNQ